MLNSYLTDPFLVSITQLRINQKPCPSAHWNGSWKLQSFTLNDPLLNFTSSNCRKRNHVLLLEKTLKITTHCLQTNTTPLCWEQGKPSEAGMLSPKHEMPQKWKTTTTKKKPLIHHVTPGLNHSKCSHFSSQMPLKVLDFLTNEAQGLSAWTSELLDLSFAGADYPWKTVPSPCPEAGFPVCLHWSLHFCFYMFYHIPLLSANSNYSKPSSTRLCFEPVPVYKLRTQKETQRKSSSILK